MALPAGEVPGEPGIDGAAEQVAAAGGIACAIDVVEDPLDFGRGKIGVEDEAGFVADKIFEAVVFEGEASVGGAAALPDDCVVDGASGAAVPDDDGFALVGEGDGGDGGRGCAGEGEDVADGCALGFPDGVGVVLDPAGARVELGEFPLGGGAWGEGAIEEDGARAGGSLVEGEDEFPVAHAIPFPDVPRGRRNDRSMQKSGDDWRASNAREKRKRLEGGSVWGKNEE